MGKGGVRGAGGRGFGFVLKIPRGGGGVQKGEGRGAGRVSAANWRIFGGANFFYGGRNVHQVLFSTAQPQFVPRTNLFCPWDKPGSNGGRKSLSVKR